MVTTNEKKEVSASILKMDTEGFDKFLDTLPVIFTKYTPLVDMVQVARENESYSCSIVNFRDEISYNIISELIDVEIKDNGVFIITAPDVDEDTLTKITIETSLNGMLGESITKNITILS